MIEEAAAMAEEGAVGVIEEAAAMAEEGAGGVIEEPALRWQQR